MGKKPNLISAEGIIIIGCSSSFSEEQAVRSSSLSKFLSQIISSDPYYVSLHLRRLFFHNCYAAGEIFK